MRNADAIRRRLDAIKQMKDKDAAFNALVDVEFEIGISACEERKKLQEQISNLKKIICGNGDYDHSLQARVSSMEKTVDNMDETMDKVLKALVGDIEDGQDNTGGMTGKLNELSDYKKNINKIVWAIVLATLAQIVNTIIGLM